MQGNEETDVLTGRAARSESTQQQLGVRLDAVERRQLTQLDEMGLVRSNGNGLRSFVDRRFCRIDDMTRRPVLPAIGKG